MITISPIHLTNVVRCRIKNPPTNIKLRRRTVAAVIACCKFLNAAPKRRPSDSATRIEIS